MYTKNNVKWESNVRKVVPYTPGEQPSNDNMIKLNTNESPYPPAPGVTNALKEFDSDKCRLYPDPTVGKLVKELAAYYHLSEKQVFVGVGSDDVIAAAFLTFFNSDKPILFPDITYSFYDVWANLYKIPYKRPRLNEDFKMVKEDYFSENGGIIFPNPNAPTGVLESLAFIEDILKANSGVIVIIDEAYIDFGGKSAASLIEKYDNLLVIQTFSKSRAMAGMRIGFAMGNEKLIQYLNDVKYSINSYTMSHIAIALGVESVRDDNYFKETVGKIITTREDAKKRLASLGFSFPDSYANFIFAAHKDKSAKEIYEALRKSEIYVRHFDLDRIDNYLRITIGTDEQMEALYEALKSYLF